MKEVFPTTKNTQPQIKVKEISYSNPDKKEAKVYPISGKKEKIQIKKFTGFEEFTHGDIEALLNTYERHKKPFHDGGSLARIYELVHNGKNIVIKEMRGSLEIKNGFIINNPEKEMDIQDELYNLGLNTPLPVSFIRISGVDYKKRQLIDREIIVMEKVSGLSVGDYFRKFQQGDRTLFLCDFSVKDFMDKLEIEVKKMHDAGYYHRDLTINNVMIDKNHNPVIIDFGASTQSFSSDPYELFSMTIIRNGERVLVQGSPRLKEDEKNLKTIEEALKTMLR